MVWSCDPYLSEDKDAEQLTEKEKSHIIGVQSNIWTEYISGNTHLEYMANPRMAAVAEVQWCQPENKDWERFSKGLDRMRKLYDLMGYNYAGHFWTENHNTEQ